MAVAVFDYAKWTAMFPYMAAVPEVVADGFFTVAELLFANDDCSPIQDTDKRLVFLNYIVAHLARLAGYPVSAGGSAQPDGMVGRISSATEGTVSIDSDYGSVRNSQAWWIQTQEGATFWQMTIALRTARYVPAPPRYFGPARRGLLGGIWRP